MQAIPKDLQLIIYQYSQEHKQERLNKEYHTNYRWDENVLDNCLRAFGNTDSFWVFNYRNLTDHSKSNLKIWNLQNRKRVADLPKRYF